MPLIQFTMSYFLSACCQPVGDFAFHSRDSPGSSTVRVIFASGQFDSLLATSPSIPATGKSTPLSGRYISDFLGCRAWFFHFCLVDFIATEADGRLIFGGSNGSPSVFRVLNPVAVVAYKRCWPGSYGSGSTGGVKSSRLSSVAASMPVLAPPRICASCTGWPRIFRPAFPSA